MDIEKINFKSCCGGTSTIFKIDGSISINLLQCLKQAGYIESSNFTKSGILYVDSLELTVTGAMGSNLLQIKCKKTAACEHAITNLELLINEYDGK